MTYSLAKPCAKGYSYPSRRIALMAHFLRRDEGVPTLCHDCYCFHLVKP